MSRPGLAAVLFDMDGLLVDSEPLWFRVEQDVMGRLGGLWSEADQAACLGGTMPATAAYMLARSGSDLSAEQVAEALIDRMAQLLHDGVPLRPGASALLDALDAAGVPYGLVSSSYRRLVDAVLDGVGHDRFGVTVAGDEVRRMKPHPDPYLTAAERLGVDPRRCVVLEDSMPGINSGEAAGCAVVGIPGVTPLESTPRRPVRSSLAEVDVAWLAGLPDQLATEPV